MIDVGGPAFWAAAKNFASVTVVVRARDYDTVLDELREWRDDAGASASAGGDRLRALGRIRGCDSALVPAGRRLSGDARTCIRPRARTAVRREPAPARRVLRRARGAHPPSRFRPPAPGQATCRSTISETFAARLLTGELDRPACVIVKHANPCGAAVAETIEEAYAKAGCGSGVGLRRRRRGQPRRHLGAGRRAGGAVRRSPVRARVRGRRARSARREAGAPRPGAHGSAHARRGGARLPEGHRGPPRPGSRLRDRRSRDPAGLRGSSPTRSGTISSSRGAS